MFNVGESANVHLKDSDNALRWGEVTAVEDLDGKSRATTVLTLFAKQCHKFYDTGIEETAPEGGWYVDSVGKSTASHMISGYVSRKYQPNTILAFPTRGYSAQRSARNNVLIVVHHLHTTGINFVGAAVVPIGSNSLGYSIER